MAANRQALKAQVEFKPAKTFNQVMLENPQVNWDDQGERQDVARAYLDRYVYSMPEWGGISQDDRNDILTTFNKTYNVGQVDLGDNPLRALEAGVNIAQLGVGSVIDPAIQSLTFGLTDPAKTTQSFAQKRFPGVETDPGMLGDAYRLYQNPGTNLAGQALGAMGGVGNIAKSLVAKGIGPKAANVLATAIFSGGSNAVATGQGKMNPMEALTNTGLDVATAPLAGANRFKNALIQGGGGAISGGVSSAVSDVSRGQNVDINRLIAMATQGGAFGAGMGAGFYVNPSTKPKLPVQTAPQGINNTITRTINGKQRKLSIKPMPSDRPNEFIQGAVPGDANALDAAKQQRTIRTGLQAVAQMQSINEQQTMQKQMREFKKLYETLDGTSKNTQVPESTRRAAGKMKGEVLKRYENLSSQYAQKFKTKVEQKANPQRIKQAAQAGVRARKQGQVASNRFNEYVNKNFSKSERQQIQARVKETLSKESDQARQQKEKASIRREIGKEKGKQIEAQRKQQAAETTRQQKAQAKEQQQTQKQIEAAKERTAVNEQKVEQRNRKEELKALKEDIIRRDKEQRTKLKAEARVDKAKEKVKRDNIEGAQSQEGILKTLKQAHKNNESVLIEYEAEGGKSGKGGESIDAAFRYKVDTPIEAPTVNNQGIVQVRVINAEGQYRTRLLHEPSSGSRIARVTRTKDAALYRVEDGQVIDVETDLPVEQVKTDAYFSSEIRAAQEASVNMDRILRKYSEGKARVGDIMNPSKYVDNAEITKKTKGKSKKIYEDTTGDKC